MLKPCLSCGRLCRNSRCPQHQLQRKPRVRDYADENLRRKLLTAWIRQHGHVCPGSQWCQPHPHPARDLTIDHLVPRHLGGTLADGYRVMCRTANSRRGTGGGRSTAGSSSLSYGPTPRLSLELTRGAGRG